MTRPAVLGSVAVHLAVLGGLMLLPPADSSPPPARRFADVELIEIREAVEPRDTATSPAPEPKPEHETGPNPSAETEPQPERERTRPPTPEPRDDPQGGAAPWEQTGSAEENPAGSGSTRKPVEVNPPPRRGALTLGGLRDVGPKGVPPRLPRGIAFDVPERDGGEIRIPEDAGFVRERDGRLVYRDPDPGPTKWTAELLPDGRIRFVDLVRPYPSRREFYVARKHALLKSTAALRTRMAIAFAKTNIDRQLVRLRRQLKAIWTSDRPPHTRRALIFALWDECEESVAIDPGILAEQSEIDTLRKAAGSRARAAIIAFVRETIPAGSRDRYTDDELRALNHERLSEERFEPYAA